MSAVRVAVIGVGHLGRHHARLLAAMDGVDLVGVVDLQADRAAAVAAEYGTRACTAGDLLDVVDAVSVAVPTEAHEAVARPFLERGVATLVEKPMAESLAAAERLIAAASAGGARLGVGHTERFNPALVAARPYITNPRFVEIHRLGTFPDWSLDIDVVFDLMIDDLDLLLDLVGAEVTGVEAVGVNVLTPRVDIANARLRFASGCIANVTASRISRERIRKARFFAGEAYVGVDFAAGETEVYGLDRGGPVPRVKGGAVPVESAEPLGRELEDFVAAVRERREPVVTGAAGRDALALATRIADQIATGVPA